MSEVQLKEDSATSTGPPAPVQEASEPELPSPAGDAPVQSVEMSTELFTPKDENDTRSPSDHMDGDKAAPELQSKADVPSDSASSQPQPELVDKLTPEPFPAASDAGLSEEKLEHTPAPTAPSTDKVAVEHSPPTPSKTPPAVPADSQPAPPPTDPRPAADPSPPADDPRPAAPPADPGQQDDSGCDTEPEPERQLAAPEAMAERSGPAMADVERLARSVVTDTLEKAKQEAGIQRQLDHRRADPDTDEDGWLDIVGNGQLKKKVLTAGTGDRSARPQRSQLATVHLSARLADGRPAVGLPDRLTFGLGDGEVVTGLDMAVGLMQPGETAEVYMDARFAYGERGLDDSVPPNADLTFTVQLESVQPEPKYEEMSAEERLEVGSQKRDRGNWWFKRDDFNHAIQCYRRALDFFDNETDEFTGLPDDVHILFEERLKVHNNMAAAQMKLEAFDAALRSLQLVLNCQPDNVKALYRKGKVLMAQNKVSEAGEALKEALRHEPENRTVQTELNRVTAVQRKQAEDQKSLYRKMLGLPPAEDRPAPSNDTKSFPVKLVVAGVACAIAAVAVSRLKLF